MPRLPLLPIMAVVCIALDLIFTRPWSGILALIGALLLLEPLRLSRRDAPFLTKARALPSLRRLTRIPAALGTLTRLRLYLLLLFLFFFILRITVLVYLWNEPPTPTPALVLTSRLYDIALAFSGFALALLQIEFHRLGRFALMLARRPAILLVSSFLLLITIGTMLLLLPAATHPFYHQTVTAAFFNMTSSVCVTGLVANDYAHVYTDFGHAISLAGIQLGGIGIMTIAAMALTFRRGAGVRSATYSRALESKNFAEMRGLVRSILFYTLFFELVGALLLWLHWRGDPFFHDKSALWYAVFHAISAFCNAGMSLFPEGMARFQGDGTTQLILMILVFSGGIGFIVLREAGIQTRLFIIKRIFRQPRPWRRVPAGVKAAFFMSLALILIGAFGIGFIENQNAFHDTAFGTQALNATFTSVVSRSAGFASLDISQMLSPTLVFLMGFMFIGGSPGSTAGGIKTTTVAVIFATLRGELRQKEPELFGRRIDPASVRRAVSVATLGAISVVLGIFITSLMEPELPFLLLTFEVMAAATTVGMSTGITELLSTPTLLFMTSVMIVGRVGPLTIAHAVGHEDTSPHYSLATEEILVG